jgi:transcriptional regulator with XRE-family HTH domain
MDHYKGHSAMGNDKAAGLLRQLLDAGYLTNSEAARRAGVSLNTIKKALTGVSPSAPKLKAIAELFAPDDAARLVAAFGLPGLTSDHPATASEAEALAAIIDETEQMLAKLRDVYGKIMRDQA